MQQMIEPDEKLHGDRLIKTERGADLRDLIRRGRFAGDEHGRVARAEAQQQEDEHRHHCRHRHQAKNTAGEEAQHQLPFSTFQYSCTGDGSTPCTSLR
jgi:hypothetical protein